MEKLNRATMHICKGSQTQDRSPSSPGSPLGTYPALIHVGPFHGGCSETPPRQERRAPTGPFRTPDLLRDLPLGSASSGAPAQAPSGPRWSGSSARILSGSRVLEQVSFTCRRAAPTLPSTGPEQVCAASQGGGRGSQPHLGLRG